ncbi:MAG: NCS2 family nucleobase:cation symporter [Proteobacteria bacterium]|nr:NCS2 family nucleobase:cation symporter [Pseudomonadota bacterium]
METTQKPILDIADRPRPGLWALLSTQHLFAMFGATVLVPLLTGLSPAVGLVTSGCGTLAYILITGGRIPVYLGSSFAFIAPIISAITIGGIEGAMIGCFFAGLAYLVVALGIRRFGTGWLMRLLPPIVVGPVIMVIGLSLAGVAIDMAMNDPATKAYSSLHFGVALFTLFTAILCALVLRGFFSLVPVLIAIASGYLVATLAGLVDFSTVIAAPLFAIPDFTVPFVTYSPAINWTILAVIVPVAIVTMAEHTGDQMVISKITGRNFLKTPGLHRSLAGDGTATMLAALLGGPPNTTYGENIGVVAITRVFSVWVIGGAAVLAVAFGFVGTIAALIQTVPTAVMGGVAIMLFGIIASSGLRMLIDNRVDFGETRNLVIASVILVLGIGGAFIQVTAEFKVAGMALAAIVGILLNLVIPGRPRAIDPDAMFRPVEHRPAG